MNKRSRYQEKLIKNYYENRDAIALQRVQEIVTEIYLATGKKRQRQWNLLRNHLEKLKVDPKTIDHLVKQDDPAQVAKLIQRLQDE